MSGFSHPVGDILYTMGLREMESRNLVLPSDDAITAKEAILNGPAVEVEMETRELRQGSVHKLGGVQVHGAPVLSPRFDLIPYHPALDAMLAARKAKR